LQGRGEEGVVGENRNKLKKGKIKGIK